jgi:hypothetical protein
MPIHMRSHYQSASLWQALDSPLVRCEPPPRLRVSYAGLRTVFEVLDGLAQTLLARSKSSAVKLDDIAACYMAHG